MELRQLEMLLSVVEEGSYAKAGQRLNIAHSAIHRQIRALEHELQERILVRSGRRVELTEPGKLLTCLARRLQREIAQSALQIRELSSLQTGRLRVGTGTTMLVFFLPDVIKRFRSEFPGVSVRLMTGTADQVMEEIESGNLDAGIVFAPPSDLVTVRPHLCSEVLYKEEFVFAVGKGHLLAKRRSCTLRDINPFPFVTYSKMSYIRGAIERLFEREGIAPAITMELENEEAIEKMIEIDMGVAMLSKRRAVSDRIHYFAVEGCSVSCDVRLVYPASDYLPRATKEFARICREVSRLHCGAEDQEKNTDSAVPPASQRRSSAERNVRRSRTSRMESR